MSFLSLKSFKKKEKFLFFFLIVFLIVFLVVSKGNLVKAIHLPEANIVVESCNDVEEKLRRVPGPPHHPPFFNPPFIDRVSYCTETIAGYHFSPRWQGLRLIRAIAEIDHGLSHDDFERIIRYYGWWGEYGSRIFNALHDEWSFADMGAICRDSGEGADPWRQLEVRCLSRAGQAKLWLNFLKLPQPDLVPDLSQIQVKVGGNIEPLPVGLDTRYRPIEISNIKVKNMGDTASSATNGQISLFDGIPSLGVIDIPAIPAGVTITLPPIEISSDELRKMDKEYGLFSFYTQFPTDTTNLSLSFRVDLFNRVEESNEENNLAKKDNFAVFSAILVEPQDEKGNRIPHALVTIENLRDDSYGSKYTNKIGFASFALLAQPGENLKYKVTVTKMDKEKSIEINVTEYKLYHLKIVLDLPDGAVFIPIPLVPQKHNPNNFESFFSSPLRVGWVSDGRAIVETDLGQIIEKEFTMTDNVFLFPRDELPEGTRFLTLKEMRVKIIISLSSSVEGEDYVNYVWLSQKQNPIRVDIEPGKLKEVEVEIKLKTDCYQATRNSKFCIYDEEEEIIRAKQGYLRIAAQELSRLEIFSPWGLFTPWGLKIIKEVWIVPFISEASGFFSPLRPNSFWLDGREIKVHPFRVRAITLHEALHALDFQWGNELFGGGFFSRRWDPYRLSVRITQSGTGDNFLTGTTGLWAWRYLGYTCALVEGEAKRFCLGYTSPDNEVEVFAEQISAICLGLPVAQKLANAEAEWQRLNPGQPVPPDLLRHRDVIASRSVGNQVSGDPGNVIYRYQDRNPITAFSLRLSWLVRVCSSSSPGG